MSTYNADVYFCGRCPREQQPSQGEKCISCKRTTVSWDKSRELNDEVMKKWKDMRAYFGENG